MYNLNLEVLENISNEKITKDINQIFSEICKEIQKFLNLEIITSKVLLNYREKREFNEQKKLKILDLGVKRAYKGNLLLIEINKEYQRFIPIILLREALMCWVPNNLKENEGIKIIINQIVEILLQKFEIINEWKPLFRNQIVDYNYLSFEFDKLEKFLKLKDSETAENSIIFFFDFIRRNVLIIQDKDEDLHDNILKDFVLKTSNLMQNDEMVETLRILINIFYKVKSYGALLEYQNYFKKFKENGEIITDLSLRKFSSNVQWINKFSYIAPSYKINWNSINVGVFYCSLKFNPILPKAKIDLVIESLPFFSLSKSSESYFEINVSGWFIFPIEYMDDLRNFLNRLESHGYIIKKTCILHNVKKNFLNLNYFREFYRKGRIINPNHPHYDKKYEINFEMELEQGLEVFKLSILDYLILNRVSHWSVDGFSFERRAKNLRSIKSATIYEVLSQRSLVKNLKKNIKKLHNNQELKIRFLKVIELNQQYGFFYIKEFLKNITTSLNLIKNILANNKDIKNVQQFKKFITKKGISININENVKFNNKHLKKIIFRDFLPIFFKNTKEINKEIRNHRLFSDFFTYCYRLKIFDLKAITKIIRDEHVVNKIYTAKERKLRNIYENYKIQKITTSDMEEVLDSFINRSPSVIKPLLINTINTTNFAKYFIEVVLLDNSETQIVINKIKKFFPRVVQSTGVDLFTKEKLNLLEMYIPNLNKTEKKLFISILYNLFKQNLVNLKRYFYDGFQKAYEVKDFYDLEKQDRFYTKDLFKQYFIYTQRILGNNLKPFKEISRNNQNIFWSSKKNFNNLIERINDRLSREQIEFYIKKLYKLSRFNANLKNILLDHEKFKKIKREEFFKKYVRSIKFKPVFQKFGFGQYFLYIHPINMKDLDLKLLLINTFQNVNYPAYIDNVHSLFIKFLFPYRNPNMSYINWLAKSKKNVSEYCMFFIKKFYTILHFDHNLDPYEWDLNPGHFKSYMQKILFDPKFRGGISKINGHKVGDLEISDYNGPDSIYFKNLAEIASWQMFDLKSILGTQNHTLIEKISDLIKNDMIINYTKLKNLDFQEKIYIILPNVKKELNELIIKIFNFFNYGFIYEIEGEYFIYGFSEEIKFENGLMIKLYLPLTEISDFQKIFDLLFQFLKIDKYLILNDMIDGNNLLKSVYGNLNFLDSYNPLKNLKWNNKDKIWMNHKLFNEKFEPIYPDLIPKE